MDIQFSKPSNLLTPYIKQYWELENCIAPNDEYIHRIIPNGLMEINFYIGYKPQTYDNKENLEENFLISGHKKNFYDIIIKDKLSMFSVTFLPYGAMMFFNLPINEFYNHNYPIKLLFKNEIAELESKLYNTNTFSDRISCVESFLIKLHRRNQNNYKFKKIKDCIDTIDKYKGNISIDTLASRSFLSKKQFERTFYECVGILPKQFLKVVRFQYTIHKKSISKKINLTSLAYECGYYDQAHMIYDFKNLSGVSPKTFFNQCDPYSDYFAQ